MPSPSCLFSTDSTGTSATLLEGRTSAQAPTKPESSSAARMAFSTGATLSMPV